MKSRQTLSLAIVALGAVLFLADTVVGDGSFSFPPAARLAIAPSAVPTVSVTSTATSTPTPISSATAKATPSPSLKATNMPTSSPIEIDTSELARREERALVASRIEGVSKEELWSELVGFAGKSNQEREQYVAERLFPQAGLFGIRKQSVPYGGKWGSEYGDWDGLSNVIGVRQGTLPQSKRKLIILGAHFDKVTYPNRSRTPGRSDGILDNASGVNTVAKIVQSLPAPLNDIEVVAFATEEPEPYFLGSSIYFGKLPDEERVAFFANFDCLGVGNLALIKGAADPALSDLAMKAANSQSIPLVWRAGTPEVVSDHVVAQYFGLKVLAFTADGYDWHNTHVPEDNLNALDKETYYQQYQLSLKIISYLDAYLAEASSNP